MLWQLYDDTSDTILNENNGVTPEWGCNPFSNNSIVFDWNSTDSIITEFVTALTLTLGVNGTLNDSINILYKDSFSLIRFVPVKYCIM